jgi:hypothetical protein
MHITATHRLPSASSPIVQWDGASPAALIAAAESRMAAGLRFVVLATPPCCDSDRALIASWQAAASGRLAASCGGWAEVVPGADVSPAKLSRLTCGQPDLRFPQRAFADRMEAMAWLRHRLGPAA